MEPAVTVIQLVAQLARLISAGHGNRPVIVTDESSHVLIIDDAAYDSDNEEVFLTYTVDGM